MDVSGQENKLFIIISAFVQFISPLKGSSRKSVELFLPTINLQILPSVTCTLHVRFSLALTCITHFNRLPWLVDCVCKCSFPQPGKLFFFFQDEEHFSPKMITFFKQCLKFAFDVVLRSFLIKQKEKPRKIFRLRNVKENVVCVQPPLP